MIASRNALTFALALAGMVSAQHAYAAEAAQPADASAQGDVESTAAGDIVVVGKFINSGAQSATKMDVRVLDTPFTVSSYSDTFVKSLESQSLSDLYNYMTGVKKSGNTGYDITLRGFKSSGDDRNAIMTDGLPGLTGRYGSPPTVNVDHIELVKGPMSVLYGQIQPGGFVNIISKKPQDKPAYSADLRLNTYVSRYRSIFDANGVTGSIDATGPIDADGNILYRVVGQLGDNDGYRDYANTKQQFISPSATIRLGDNTKLTAQFEYRHTKEHFDVGLVAPPNAADTVYDITAVAPITTTYQQPADFRVETGKAETVFLTHNFGGGWKGSASYRHVDYNSDQKEFSNTGLALIQGQYRVLRRARQLQTKRRYDYADLNLQGTFNTFGIEHKLLVGGNFGSDLVNENRLKFFNSSTRNTTTGVCPTGGTCLDIGLYNPDYSTTPAFDTLAATNPQLSNQASLLTNRFVRSHNYGIYLSDLMTLTNWLKVSLSGRKFSETSEVEADARNAPGVIKKKTDSRNFLPSAGILIQPQHNITIYGSYAESFVPTDPAAFGEDGQNNFTPIEGKQYEVGIKTENLLNGALTLSAALYRIDQVGQITQNPCPSGAIAQGTCSYQIGKGRSDGFELEGNLRPFKGMQVIFGYAHIKANVLTAASSAQTFQIGRRLPNVANDAANLWMRYDWKNGLGLGLGVTYTGDRDGLLPTSSSDLKTLDLPAYTVVDSAIYYDTEHLSINLKVGNLFDKRYYESAGATGRIQISPGQPRNVTLTTRVKF